MRTVAAMTRTGVATHRVADAGDALALLQALRTAARDPPRGVCTLA